MIRFWDTSALVKVYSTSEPGYRDAVRLLHGRRSRTVRQATSMLAGVELVSALARRTRDQVLATAAMRQLETFSQVEFAQRHRDAALRLALFGTTRGADTAIAAQALVVAGAAPEQLEFVTADAAQGRLVRKEAARRRLDVTVIELPS